LVANAVATSDRDLRPLIAARDAARRQAEKPPQPFAFTTPRREANTAERIILACTVLGIAIVVSSMAVDRVRPRPATFATPFVMPQIECMRDRECAAKKADAYAEKAKAAGEAEREALGHEIAAALRKDDCASAWQLFAKKPVDPELHSAVRDLELDAMMALIAACGSPRAE
jgi:hypothetical protein